MPTVADATATVQFDYALTADAPRTAWRAAVAEVAAKAQAALPQCNGRIAKAAALVLAGDVEVLGDGTARAASQTNGQTRYHIVNGHCDCKDYPKTPEGWCKHRLAHALVKRAYPLAKQTLNGTHGQAEPPRQPTPMQPDALVETPQGLPAQHVVLIQGKPFVKFTGLLPMAHERGLVALTADWTYNDVRRESGR